MALLDWRRRRRDVTTRARPVAVSHAPRRAASRPPGGRSPRSPSRHSGVVYGDIGTSPLYALQGVLHGAPRHSTDPRQRPRRPLADLLVAQLRGLLQVHPLRHAGRQPRRGRHPGAAGAHPAARRRAQRAGCWSCCGLFGAALLYGDGVITRPSRCSARSRGSRSRPRRWITWVVPIAIVILLLLFLFQSTVPPGGPGVRPGHGGLVRLHRGARGRRHRPQPPVLRAMNPWYAVDFFMRDGLAGIPDPRGGGAGDDRRRGALRRHGAFRQAADPGGLVRPGAARAACSTTSARGRCC